jgi:hypothetical protein
MGSLTPKLSPDLLRFRVHGRQDTWLLLVACLNIELLLLLVN